MFVNYRDTFGLSFPCPLLESVGYAPTEHLFVFGKSVDEFDGVIVFPKYFLQVVTFVTFVTLDSGVLQCVWVLLNSVLTQLILCAIWWLLS